MQKKFTILAAISLNVFWACGSNNARKPSMTPGVGQVFPEGTDVSTQSEAAGIVTASINHTYPGTQLLKASSGGNISQVVLAIPPGSLSISTDISLREAPTIGSELLLRELGLSATPQVTSSGAAVSVSSSQPIDLLKPMILALPLPVSLGLVTPAQIKNLGVLYRIVLQGTGEKLIGFIPATELNITLNSKKINFPSRYFGTFQVVEFDKQVAKTESVDTVSHFDGIEFVLMGTALPSCGPADVGRTVYVQEEAIFKFCGGGGWQVIDLKGPVGATGAAGSVISPSNELSVFDATGRNLGKFEGTYAGSGSSKHLYYVKQPDGVTVKITREGTLSPVDEAATCYYANNDCTGTCVGRSWNNAFPGDMVLLTGFNIGGTGSHEILARLVELINGPVTTNSHYSNTCIQGAEVLNSSFTIAPYTPPFPNFNPPVVLRIP